MPFTRYDPRSRYRQRSQQHFTALVTLLLVGGIAVGLGYGVGYQAARMDKTGFQAEIDKISQERDELRQTVTRLMADSHSATLKYQQMEEQLQSELPSDGPLKDIVAQIRDQLTAGVAPDRLANLIRTMRPPKNCVDAETRRFIVQTPKNSSADNKLALADGAISIAATGVSAKDKEGKDESWFDPSQPVTLSFSWKDQSGAAKDLERKAILPISQVVVVGGKEYRLTFSEGAKSFLKVAYDSCDYP